MNEPRVLADTAAFDWRDRPLTVAELKEAIKNVLDNYTVCFETPDDESWLDITKIEEIRNTDGCGYLRLAAPEITAAAAIKKVIDAVFCTHKIEGLELSPEVIKFFSAVKTGSASLNEYSDILALKDKALELHEINISYREEECYLIVI
ncbi:MAG: hypothetical protein H6Q74_2984 [Firmicutes bacterium]|nr:hypothetical protein [Bacillota bacterium]